MEQRMTQVGSGSILHDENTQSGNEECFQRKASDVRSVLIGKLRSGGVLLDQDGSFDSHASQELSNIMIDICQESNSSRSNDGGKMEVTINPEDDRDIMFIDAQMNKLKDRGQGSTQKAFRLMNFLDKYEVKKGSTKPKTHGFMGLKKFISTPIELSFEVRKAYHESIFPNGNEQEDPEDFCFAECLSDPLFLFFMDCDFKWTKPVDSKEMNRVVLNTAKAMVRTLRKFFPQFEKMPTKELRPEWDHKNQEWNGSGTGNNRYRILVASSGRKEGLNKNGEREWGLGLHIHSIGRCRVTSNQALIMRKYMMEECIKLMGYREAERGENPFPSVLDEGVLKGLGGVRSLYCSKVKPCPECSAMSDFLDKRRENTEMVDYFKNSTSSSSSSARSFSNLSMECAKCGGRKKILSRQSYKPLFVMNHREEIDQSMIWLCENRLEAILATSIRTGVVPATLPKEDEWQWPQDLGDYNVWLDSLSIKEKRPLDPKSISESKVAHGTAAKMGEMYSANSEEMQLALNAVWSLGDGVYRDVKPSEGLRRKHKYVFRLNIDKGMDPKGPARWCFHCGKHHENRSYFEFKLDGIYQKNYSEDCNNKFTKFPISDQLAEILFGTDAISFNRKKKSKLSVSSIAAPFVIPTIAEANQQAGSSAAVDPNNLNPSPSETIFSAYKTFLTDVRNRYINSTYVDEKRKKLIENEKKKWMTKASKKSMEKRPDGVPFVYVDDEGKEQITPSVTVPNARGSGILQKKASQTIQWTRCVSDR